VKLSEMNCSRGAPMGRQSFHDYTIENPEFELEHVPFVDGAYDAGGAYWGSPEDLYCAEHLVFNESTETDGHIRFFIRAASREKAMEQIRVESEYPNAKFKPENGSLITQMIEHLRKYQATLGDTEEDREIDNDVECDIGELEDRLREIQSKLEASNG
jgi:hypothetical protein